MTIIQVCAPTIQSTIFDNYGSGIWYDRGDRMIKFPPEKVTINQIDFTTVNKERGPV